MKKWPLGIGLWLSIAVYMGIVARSWPLFGGLFGIAVFFCVFALAVKAASWKHGPIRILGKVGSVVCALIIVAVVLNTFERVYLVNADTYPSFLARSVDNVDIESIGQLRSNECKDDPIEVFEKKKQTWVMRCGNSWLTGHTYMSHTNPFGQSAQGAVK